MIPTPSSQPTTMIAMRTTISSSSTATTKPKKKNYSVNASNKGGGRAVTVNQTINTMTAKAISVHYLG